MDYNKFLDDIDLREEAKRFATKKHSGQFRQDGTPYITHPLRVAEIVLQYKESHRMDELVAAAYLHDTLEETDTGVNELSENFGYLVALLVVELTTDKFACDKIGKTEYMKNKLSNEKALGHWALAIKLADRLDNVSDLNERDEDFARGYKKQTLEILKAIETRSDLRDPHLRLIEAIRNKLDEVNL